VVVGSNPGEVTITPDPNGTNPTGLTLDPLTGAISIDAGTPSGTYLVEYELCENGANPVNCDIATATVVVSNPIDAIDDDYSASPLTIGDSTGDVTDNDTLDGSPVVVGSNPGEVTITPDPNGTNPTGLTLDPLTGVISIDAGTPSGTYLVEYEICENGANPANCDIATATVVVSNPIDAIDDDYSASPLTIGDSTGDVTDNDTLDGSPVVVGSNPGEVTITPDPNGTNPTGLTLNPLTGVISIDAGTPSGTYLVEYELCENGANPANCDIATATVVVDADPPVVTLTIDSITGDDTLDSNEISNTVTITGTVTGEFNEGDIVTLTINGIDYSGPVDALGNYSIDVPGSELADDIDLQIDGSVTTFDQAGNEGSASAIQTYTLLDTDGDLIPDYLDVDDDNDGIPDVAEGNVDTDGDGIPDSLDLDSDNDGILDVDEGGNGDLDTNNDGVIDENDNGFVDEDLDGQADDSVDTDEEPDTDNDGVPDYQDLDSDNDGINDVIEDNNVDNNNDGIADGDDADGDGIVDSVDANDTVFGEGENGEEPNTDSDGDGIPDYRDLDSDDDGVNDVVEGGNGSLDVNGDGLVDGPDSDGDGIVDGVDEDNGSFGDTGNTGTNDSDPTDPNSGGNGTVSDSGTDSDGDGIADSVDGLDGFGDAPIDDGEVNVFNVLTPNGDGDNDTLIIQGIENYPNNTLEIFNRWGNTVYKKVSYDNSWDGTSNGRVTIQVDEKLPTGTYYYVLDLGNGSKPKVGWIYLNKD
ncbi:T9SS type B sorting domain-containing protein, partial [Tenacibaculum geojense]